MYPQLVSTSVNENLTLTIAWWSKDNVFVGIKDTLVSAHGHSEGEVRSGVLDMKIFFVINLSNQSEHEKPF